MVCFTSIFQSKKQRLLIFDYVGLTAFGAFLGGAGAATGAAFVWYEKMAASSARAQGELRCLREEFECRCAFLFLKFFIFFNAS
jgi:hypothetical protein